MSKSVMSPVRFSAIRRKLDLSQAALAAKLHLGSAGGRTIRRWESGEAPIFGPVAVAMLAIEAGIDLSELDPDHEKEE